jgi:hypothetical protein
MSEIEVQNEDKSKFFDLIKAVIKALRHAEEGSFEIYLKPPLYLNDDEFKSLFGDIDSFGGFVELGGYFFAENYYTTSITKNGSTCTENRKHVIIMFRIMNNNMYEVVHVKGMTEPRIIDCP